MTLEGYPIRNLFDPAASGLDVVVPIPLFVTIARKVSDTLTPTLCMDSFSHTFIASGRPSCRLADADIDRQIRAIATGGDSRSAILAMADGGETTERE